MLKLLIFVDNKVVNNFSYFTKKNIKNCFVKILMVYSRFLLKFQYITHFRIYLKIKLKSIAKKSPKKYLVKNPKDSPQSMHVFSPSPAAFLLMFSRRSNNRLQSNILNAVFQVHHAFHPID